MAFKRLFGREGDRLDDLETGLDRTRRGLLGQLAAAFRPIDITEATWVDLEEILIGADVGAATAAQLVQELRGEARASGIRRADELPRLLADMMVEALRSVETGQVGVTSRPGDGPVVVMVVGTNGGGKTTSIAKLAQLLKSGGQDVVLVAADTFRAAAAEQLEAWGQRVGVPVVAGGHGADPGAVVYDALGSNVGRRADTVIIDTAGRLHTQTNLMQELAKIANVAARIVPGAPHETLLVLDATTGQNGLAQARTFLESVGVTGLVLAKLDSSSKGGIAFAVARQLAIPILFVGTGEGLEDMAVFESEAYVHALLGLARGDHPTDA